jgi:hypothetical protein
MHRYFMHEGPTAFRFELAGALNAIDAARLEKDWRAASSILRNRSLIVDMSFVTAIDEQVRRLFRRWYQLGAQFVASTRRSRELVESITQVPFRSEAAHALTYQPW